MREEAMQPADDARDYQAFLAEPYPCESCRLAARCRASLEADYAGGVAVLG